jgi:acetyl esterase/lipase
MAAPPLSRDTIGELRTLADRRFADKLVYGSTRPRWVTISNADADIDLFIFEPEQTTTPKPCLLWLHGGGYVMGSLGICGAGRYYQNALPASWCR